MAKQPLLVLQHASSLSIGGILRYRFALDPENSHHVKSLLFKVKNTSPVYRNLTPGSGPWKIAIALVRDPEKTPTAPDLVPSLGCGQVSNLEATVEETEEDPHENHWELEIMSEMVLQPNWVDFKVEVYAQLKDGTKFLESGRGTTTASSSSSPGTTEKLPQVLYPRLISCTLEDTATICGATYPQDENGMDQTGEKDLHLVVLTHGIHGSWLDMLYLKEQIDSHYRSRGKTVTLLTDTNHAGTEEGIQMAGQRVALDILQFTGYCDSEEGKRTLVKNMKCKPPVHVSHVFATSACHNCKELQEEGSNGVKGHSKEVKSSTNRNGSALLVFPRRFNKISVIGHSLGGLVNIYALGYIQEKTGGAFFQEIVPAHFLTIATPLLGVGFEHPWVLGYALSQGVIGQTGKDLSLKDRSTLSRSATTSTTEEAAAAAAAALSQPLPLKPCELDTAPEPLLVEMARPGSVSHSALKLFQNRTSYANLDNDMAVRFQTSTMMGIPTFDLDHYFSAEGKSPQPKKNLYASAVSSTMALMFPAVPSKKKLLEAFEQPSPIVIVSHVPSLKDDDDGVADEIPPLLASESINKSVSSSTPCLSGSSSFSSSLSSSTSASSKTKAKTRQELAEMIAQAYHADMDWTKIGVFIASEAHVQIIVRRKWYNLDGWKCIQDIIERHDFS